jgi:phosphoglycolate phosphatase-like HAD superfamily hydrolase
MSKRTSLRKAKSESRKQAREVVAGEVAVETVRFTKGVGVRPPRRSAVRTDPQITSMVLGDAGFSEAAIAARAPHLWETYLGELAKHATSERVRALPGIRELLDRLAAMNDVTLALLTGNIERGARLKLAPPELNRYFPFGAFGSDSAQREELPPIAVERASRIDGHRFRGREVVIIGDSIYDVRCGAPHDATTIAIASGKTSAEKLRAENPHHFFESAEGVEELVRAIID